MAAALTVASVGLSSCVGDLDVENINPQKTSTTEYDYILNKVYANLVLTGQKGPDGEGDLDDIDEGKSYVMSKDGNPGPWTTKLYNHLRAIQLGDEPDTHNWVTVLD